MIKNFVLETANAPGTSTTFNLGGAATDRFSFAGAGFTNGQLCFYFMDDGAQFEYGIATFNTGSPNTLSRTTVLGNSSGLTTRLNFTGTTDVYNEIPAEKAIYADNNALVALPGALTAVGAGTFGGLLQGKGRTDGSNPAAGNTGEYKVASATGASSVVTISIASPGVVTWAGHGILCVAGESTVALQFTTTGVLPTGLTSPSVQYWVIPVDSGHFQLATSAANAIAGIAINTSGSQSGVHTAYQFGVANNNVAMDCIAMQVPAGDWDVCGSTAFAGGGGFSVATSWTSTTGHTVPSPPTLGGLQQWLTPSAMTTAPVLSTRPERYSSSGSQLIFLSSEVSISSTAGIYGLLRARRES